MDYSTLETLRQNHPAWRLLCAKHAPLVASFLHRVFIAPNVRNLPQADLVEKLEDDLYHLRAQWGPEAFPSSAQSYLNDWAENDKAWLRKFYPAGSDEAHFDLSPATEKALFWLESLTERSFIGTESRLLTLFELLRQMSEGSQSDPQLRIAELQKRRDDIDAEISRILAGDIPLLDDTALRDRFQQFVQLARELLTDFREVEHNFRSLDRHVRERIALWEGAKGSLLEAIMGERDAIADSDQGKSFRAFWDFLMSQSRQEEFTQMLEEILALPAISAMEPESRLRRVHYDWLEAGEHTQRTVAKLSEQLRKFLDDQAWLENRRIMDILHNIESNAFALRETLPPNSEAFMALDELSPSIELGFERNLYQAPFRPVITEHAVEEEDSLIDTAALFSQVVINRAELTENIRRELQERKQVSLLEVIQQHPLQHGLAELLAYLQIAAEWPNTAEDEEAKEVISWELEGGIIRKATLARIILLRDV